MAVRLAGGFVGSEEGAFWEERAPLGGGSTLEAVLWGPSEPWKLHES